MGTGALPLGLKAQELKADPSPPTSADVKNEWRCISNYPYAPMVWTGTTLFLTFMVDVNLSEVKLHWFCTTGTELSSQLHVPGADWAGDWMRNTNCLDAVPNERIKQRSPLNLPSQNRLQIPHKECFCIPAWPINAGPTLWQCCVLRRVSWSLNSRWRESDYWMK